MKSLAEYDPIFAQWNAGFREPIRWITRVFSWGYPHPVSVQLVMLVGGPGGPAWLKDYDPRYQPHLTCSTCPYWGVDKYGQNNCASPENIELYDCPQYMGHSPQAVAPNHCALILGRNARMVRRYRIMAKRERIYALQDRYDFCLCGSGRKFVFCCGGAGL